jgi:hypothetical protein
MGFVGQRQFPITTFPVPTRWPRSQLDSTSQRTWLLLMMLRRMVLFEDA